MINLEVRKYLSEIGKKGGKARAKSLSKKRLVEIGKLAIKARWDKKEKQNETANINNL